LKVPGLLTLGVVSGSIILLSILAMPIIFRFEENTQLSESQAKAVLTAFRRCIDNDEALSLPATVKTLGEDVVPLVLTVWRNGRRAKVLQRNDLPLEQSLKSMRDELRKSSGLKIDAKARLQFDFVVAEGWIPDEGLLAVLAFADGHDGLSGQIGDERVYVPPGELIRLDKYGRFKPLPDYDSKFRIGLDVEKLKKTIKHQGTRFGLNGDVVQDLARFRALTVVEGNDFKPRRLLKASVERPAPDHARVRASVLAGARYLVNAIGEDGVFHYYYNPVLDQDEPGEYNWPRHAGVTYSLALVGRILKQNQFVTAAARALDRFEEQLGVGPEDTVCLESNGKCYLGSSALGLLALAEYRISSGDKRYDGSAAGVARFLMAMQRSDGFFFHDWYPKTGIDKELMKLYASQQAVFALARYSKATGDKSALSAAIRGMDYLAGPYWDHFLGSFFFGQEHWTCLAAEEVYSLEPKHEYAELCHGIGVHYDNIMHNEAETPFEEDVGGMSITHVFTPHIGGTATAAEAMVSAVVLGEKAGFDTKPLKEQLAATFGFLIRGQVTVHDLFWIKRSGQSIGGFYETATKTKIRIDNVQHSISGMARGLEFVFSKSSQAEMAAAERDYQL
jgi:hypothetical protein